MKTAFKVLLPFIALSALGFGPAVATEKKPLHVFILAGQSNMEGHGFVAADPQRNGGRGSLEFLLKNPATAPRFATFATADGQWRRRDDVWISYLQRHGPL
ncbi:MAG: hypothetical protein ACKOTF_13735, partial [Opitutaceae bacterium]